MFHMKMSALVLAKSCWVTPTFKQGPSKQDMRANMKEQARKMNAQLSRCKR